MKDERLRWVSDDNVGDGELKRNCVDKLRTKLLLNIYKEIQMSSYLRTKRSKLRSPGRVQAGIYTRPCLSTVQYLNVSKQVHTVRTDHLVT